MSSADDSRPLDRYVAGLDVDPDELARAIAARAIDRTLVVEALLRALAHPEAVVRMRAAERIAELERLAPPHAASLAVIAENDADRRVRVAAGAALRAHAERVPPALPTEGEPARAAAWRRLLPAIWLGQGELAPRAPRPERFPLLALDRKSAPGVSGSVAVGDDELTIELRGLPEAFVGTRPVIRLRDAGGEPTAAIATEAPPVAADGSVTIRVVPAPGTVRDVAARLAAGFELTAVEL